MVGPLVGGSFMSKISTATVTTKKPRERIVPVDLLKHKMSALMALRRQVAEAEQMAHSLRNTARRGPPALV
jgi:hypothetical protein